MEQTEDRTPKSRRKLLLILALSAALAVLYAALCTLSGAGIYPNVTVLGVPLGGLDRTEAAAALTRAVREAPADRGVVFQAWNGEGETRTVQVPLTWAVLDPEDCAHRAWDVGHDAPPPLRGGVYLKCLFAGAEISPAFGHSAALDRCFDRVDEELGQRVVETTWTSDETRLTITKGQPGSGLDRTGLETAIFNRMARNDVTDLTDDAQPRFTAALMEVLPEDLDLSAVLKRVERPVQNAAFDKENNHFQADSPGISFDPVEVQTAFDAMDWGETRTIPLTITQPETTVADLEPQLYQDVLGTCTTSIAGTENRVKNISLAAGYFSDTTLLPGETFSYNDTVGRRTADRGFLPAPVYVSGQTVQETGGGVCQGSSTIYLAALRANLAIVERYNHGYITRYVPDGMDATVYYGVKDLKFQNDTSFPIKLVGEVSGRSLTVTILGTKTDNLTVEMTNRTVGQTSYRTVYKVDPSLSPGQTRVAVTPYTGYKIQVYRNLYDNGVLVDTKLESTNVYRSRDKVVMVSSADARKYGLRG